MIRLFWGKYFWHKGQKRWSTVHATTTTKKQSAHIKWLLGLGMVGISGSLYLYNHSDFRNYIKDFIIVKMKSEEQKKEDIQMSNIIHWVPPKRSKLIQQLKETEEYDLIIIGGGATGTGCALEAASRGLKVACLERDDFASGTSSRSTKLVHGGVRYLEKAFKELDYEQYKLVKEALSERATFLKIAPYLTYHIPIMIPIYKWHQVPYYWAGSKIYDLLAGREKLKNSYFLSKSKALDAFPMLKSNSLIGAMVYYDGQHNDSRMNLAIALTAIFYGATVVNHTEVVELKKTKKTLPPNDLLSDLDGSLEVECLNGVKVKDLITGEIFELKAKGIINATGPFCDKIRAMDNPGFQAMVAPSAGIHIVLPSYYSPRNMGLIDPKTSDGRVIFFLPWEGNTIAGTTDSPTELSFSPMPSEKEIRFIMNEVSCYLADDIQLRRSDVLSAWSGIRPLVKDLTAKNTESLVRSHVVHISKSGLLSIVGGKWTTYRNMGEETINEAIRAFNLSPNVPSHTKNLLLLGSHGYKKTSYLKLIQQYGFDTELAQHLVSTYGDRAFAVATLAELSGSRWPVHGRRLVPWYPYIEGEVRYSVRNEYALTAIDVLARRTRLAFLNAQAALEALPKVIRIMSEELNWSPEKQTREYIDGKNFLQTMGLSSEIPSRTLFTKDQLVDFRKVFNELDATQSGYIHQSDLPVACKKLRWNIRKERIDHAIEQSGLPLTDEKWVDFGLFVDMLADMSDKRLHEASGFKDKNELNPKIERSGGGV